MQSRNQREGYYFGHGPQSDHRPGHYRIKDRAMSLKGLTALQCKAMDNALRIKADVVKKLGDR